MGGKFKQKKSFTSSQGRTSRKELRKQQRKEKRAKKNEYFRNKKKLPVLSNPFESQSKNKPEKKLMKKLSEIPEPEVKKAKLTNKKPVLVKSFIDDQNKLHKQEMKEKAKLERGILNQRKKMLLEANKEEEKEIKRLEKQLKLNKRKTKTLPKSFVEEGLDWLLEVCDTDKPHEGENMEIKLEESGSEFEDDLAVITGQGKRKLKNQEGSNKKNKTSEDSNCDDSFDELSNLSSHEDEDDYSGSKNNKNNHDDEDNSDENFDSGESENEERIDQVQKLHNVRKNCKNKDLEINESDNSEGDGMLESEDISEEDEPDEDNESSNEMEHCNDSKKENNGLWEDIYGRLRDHEGNVVKGDEKGKYIPPQLRAKELGQDSKRVEELNRLKKQLKGLINRLAESNLHSISNQIDELYMQNSRNDMNDSLLSLISDALVSNILTPERLVMEHTALIAVLHANVGLEVGAHFLQNFVQRFDSMFKQTPSVENKEIDNVLLIVSHLYNFKVFHAVLMYNILDQLVKQFTEKEVELILLVLRSVGFTLRKDDPLALKDLVLRIQKKANESTHLKDNPRVRFMLDTLLAVKNNNVAKIPQYDPSYSEHLKKLIKTMIHKGKYVTELKITLEDLLEAENRGRWWIVGSAWSGTPATASNETQTSTESSGSQFSKAVLELAKKQRMNTDTRRNIFCILVTAEDYLDAFENLLRLGLKAQQEQEIIYVMIHCLLQEKVYNPYYAHLATQFCRADRKHQMTIQYHLWDKFKELAKMSHLQITNMAKFLAHLFLEKALPISVLKVIQFSEMDKVCVRLLRQVLLSVLLNDSEEAMAAVFARVSRPEKLHMFRESLRLFLHHFVLRNVTDIPPDQATKLKERVKLAETALIIDDNRTKYF